MGKHKITSVISVVLVLLVLAGIVGAIIKFTNVKDKVTDIFDTTFRVEYDGVNYKGNDNHISLPKSGKVTFRVKGCDGYQLKVIGNATAENDFLFTVDGNLRKLSEQTFSDLFLDSNNLHIGYFEIDCSQDYSFESVLSKRYNGATVEFNDDIQYPYVLVVSSDKGEKVSFAIRQATPVEGIEQFPENIIL